MKKKTQITIYYDGECPVCHAFVHFLRLKDIYEVELISMRSNNHCVEEFDRKGINLDEGFVVIHDEVILQGEEAFLYLDAVLSNEKKLFHAFFHFIVKTPILRKITYRSAVCLRNSLLIIQGRQPLHPNTKTMKGKCGKCFDFVHFTFGGSIALIGLGKLLGGSSAWSDIGNMALGLFDAAGSAPGFAVFLGLIVALLEFFGGLSFAAKCGKTAKYSALGLSIIMLFVLALEVKGVYFELAATSGYNKVPQFLFAIMTPMLYGAVFASYAFKGFMCCSSSCKMVKKESCCMTDGSGGSCCSSEKECNTKEAPKNKAPVKKTVAAKKK